MINTTDSPIRLAKTQKGEVILFANGELRYAFQFGRWQRHLTADEFHRLHDSAMEYNLKHLPAKPIRLQDQSTPYVGMTATLFGSLTRADLVELKELLGRAALMVTSLARVWNDVN